MMCCRRAEVDGPDRATPVGLHAIPRAVAGFRGLSDRFIHTQLEATIRGVFVIPRNRDLLRTINTSNQRILISNRLRPENIRGLLRYT